MGEFVGWVRYLSAILAEVCSKEAGKRKRGGKEKEEDS